MLREKPKRKLALQIAPNAVTADKIAPSAVIPEKISPRVINEMVRPITNDLQNQINTLGADGTAVSTQFGDNDNVTVSQKALTQAISQIWSKFEEITGELLQGISLVCTPNYYIGEEGSTVTITADTVDINGIFEEINFWINGVHIGGDENVYHYEFTTEINETSVVRCVAKILGCEYEKSETITHYSSFWMGGGNNASDVMTFANIRAINNHMHNNYNVTLANGQKIIIVLGETLREQFIRADMNGMEIQFVETTQTINDNVYKVFTSENTYQAGTYNIDINS